MESTDDAFRRRLRHAIRSHGITQSELARQLGVRDATVSDWFNRGTMPSGATMLQLPVILKVNGHWLLTGESHVRGPDSADGVTLSAGERERLSVLLGIALQILHAGADGEAGRRAGEDRPPPASAPAERDRFTM